MTICRSRGWKTLGKKAAAPQFGFVAATWNMRNDAMAGTCGASVSASRGKGLLQNARNRPTGMMTGSCSGLPSDTIQARRPQGAALLTALLVTRGRRRYYTSILYPHFIDLSKKTTFVLPRAF
jgi:hypothetical protein